MVSGQRALGVALVLLMLVASLGPVGTTQEGPEQPSPARDRHVPQSLWGVKADVGLNVVREALTNYGDRSFWQARPTGEDVRLAVIDTGLDLSHPDLGATLACGHCWRDFVNGQPSPYDDNGHGTHVAGIIAGGGHLQGNPLNSYFPTGARGLATDAELIVAKAMNETGGGSDQRVAEAIEWAMDPDGEPGTGDEPHIIHLSLGVRAPTTPDPVRVRAGSQTEDVVQDAIEQGRFVVMSAGNQGEQGPATPGQVDGVIAVGALDNDGKVLAFSNRGQGVDVFAPGVVMSAWPRALDQDGIEDGYTGLAGTSQAAPVVTGALALVLDVNPALRGEDGATKVQHLEAMVQRTGIPVEGTSSATSLDTNALIASQDQGTDGIAWTVVSAVTIVTLLLLALILRGGLVLLRRHAEEMDDEEATEPAGNPGVEFEASDE